MLRADPLPDIETRMLGGEVDVGIGSGEPHRKPFLAIATISHAHYSLGNLARHIVVKPALALSKDLNSVSADLLFQLTRRRLVRPRRHPDATTDEHEAR
jgi:hypothetical protein